MLSESRNTYNTGCRKSVERKRPLSVLEMNLLLETIIYGNNMDYLHKCRVLMEYIDTGYYDEILYLIFDYPHKHYTFKHFEV